MNTLFFRDSILQNDANMTDHLTILVSECRLYPDGEDEPLLAPPTGGPGIPGMLGTEFTGLASSTLQQIPREKEREREKQMGYGKNK